MIDSAAFRRLALALPGTIEITHFDRLAYRRRVIFASLARDGATANMRLPPERQVDLIDRFPHVLQRVDNKWGDRGWSTIRLGCTTETDLAHLLALAHEAAA
ncbi:MmcQ/YjbR family DNA-binding protein [Afifella pfennigii]|uniref:MmcQ/YjbR family DNA-binding protein n=1 Tax=Afifella pfennigii TaxID=209897 RepID=UPI0005581D2C|nr:MmcQ/YjbR family DNA-binding protein [Afifella pfennigii]